MNFIEAALSVLKKSRKTLTSEQLAERAARENLLEKPGAEPQRNMKAALNRELKKGDESRVVRIGEDRWQLAGAEEETAKPKAGQKQGAKKQAAQKQAGKKAATAAAPAASRAKTAAKTTAAKPAAPAAKKGPAKQAVEAEAGEARKAPAPGARKKKATKARRGEKRPARAAEEARAELETRVEEPAAALEPAVLPEAEVLPLAEEAGAELAEMPGEEAAAEARPLSPEEAEIQAIYGDELTATEPGAAFAEYRDAQTVDEDRPMLPEIVGARRGDRRERRRRRRDRDRDTRHKDRGAPAGEQRRGRPADIETAVARAPQPVKESAAAEVLAEDARAPERLPAEAVAETPRREMRVERAELRLPPNPLGSAAVEVMSSNKGNQPLRARQIAQMVGNRELLGGDPEQSWPYLKAALLSDEQDYLARGLRPRVVHRGRDLFALGDGAIKGDDALGQAESTLARAADRLSALTQQTLKERLGKLERSALERVVHVLLMRQGWQNIEWIKRVQRSSYGVGEAPGGMGTVLVSVRAGDDPVDRRGVGELRVGIQAKNLPSGLLVAPQDLSDVARQELRRPGPSISLLVGDALVAALIQNNIGVRRTQVPVVYIDETFLREVAID